MQDESRAVMVAYKAHFHRTCTHASSLYYLLARYALSHHDRTQKLHLLNKMWIRCLLALTSVEYAASVSERHLHSCTLDESCSRVL